MSAMIECASGCESAGFATRFDFVDEREGSIDAARADARRCRVLGAENRTECTWRSAFSLPMMTGCGLRVAARTRDDVIK